MSERTETARLLQEEYRAAVDVLVRVKAFLAQTDDLRIASINACGVRALIGDFHRLLESEFSSPPGFVEQVLLPLLDRQGARELSALIAAERAGMRPLADCLRRICAAALQGGFEMVSWAAFQGLAQAFSEQMLRHLEHKETALLRAVDAALDPAHAPGLDGELAEAYRAAVARMDDPPPAVPHPTKPRPNPDSRSGRTLLYPVLTTG